MNVFQLPQPTTVYLDKLNTRVEHHGDQKVVAIDLKCTLQTHSIALDMFHPELRTRLYTRMDVPPEDPDGQKNMELPVSELPNIALTQIEYPIKWNLEASGYTARIDYGRGGKSDIIIKLCVLKNVKFTPIEGGSVEIEFTLSSAADIDEGMVGKLGFKQQTEMVLTLTPPTVDELSRPVDGAGKMQDGQQPDPNGKADKNDKKADNAAKVTDIFAASKAAEMGTGAAPPAH